MCSKLLHVLGLQIWGNLLHISGLYRANSRGIHYTSTPTAREHASSLHYSLKQSQILRTKQTMDLNPPCLNPPCLNPQARCASALPQFPIVPSARRSVLEVPQFPIVPSARRSEFEVPKTGLMDFFCNKTEAEVQMVLGDARRRLGVVEEARRRLREAQAPVGGGAVIQGRLVQEEPRVFDSGGGDGAGRGVEGEGGDGGRQLEMISKKQTHATKAAETDADPYRTESDEGVEDGGDGAGRGVEGGGGVGGRELVEGAGDGGEGDDAREGVEGGGDGGGSNGEGGDGGSSDGGSSYGGGSNGEEGDGGSDNPDEPAAVKGKHVCKTCKKVFKFANRLKRHSIIHSDERPYVCPICALTFKSAHGRDGHAEKCGKLGLHACSQCDKTFANAKGLGVHVKTHSESFICATCDKTFASAGALSMHLRTHSGDKGFACTTCGLKFAQKGSMQRHMSTHSGEQPHACKVCGQTFSQLSSMRRHMSVHSLTKKVNKKPVKDKVCETCDRAFDTNSHLKDHVNRMHSTDRPHECQTCKKRFSMKSDLRQHEPIHEQHKRKETAQGGSSQKRVKAQPHGCRVEAMVGGEGWRAEAEPPMSDSDYLAYAAWQPGRDDSD